MRKIERQGRDCFTHRPQREASFSFFKSKRSILQVVKEKRIRQSANDKNDEKRKSAGQLADFILSDLVIMKMEYQGCNQYYA